MCRGKEPLRVSGVHSRDGPIWVPEIGRVFAKPKRASRNHKRPLGIVTEIRRAANELLRDGGMPPGSASDASKEPADLGS